MIVWARAVAQSTSRAIMYTKEQIIAALQAITGTENQCDDATWDAASQWAFDEQVDLQKRPVEYLNKFGYKAVDAKRWKISPGSPEGGPIMEFDIDKDLPHKEHAGHTWYLVRCKMYQDLNDSELKGGEKPFKSWCAPRRLHQMRDSFHDPIKELFGIAYSGHFGNAHFARHGAPMGTSCRLRDWLSTLAQVINSGLATPDVVALTLMFFCGPDAEEQASI